MIQRDIFDTPAGRQADTTATAQRAAYADAEARDKADRAVRRALADAGLWGFPNLVKNVAGPWKRWNGHGGSPVEHDLCWPMTYLVRVGGEGIEVKLSIREGQDANPAVAEAYAALRSIATVTQRRSVNVYRDLQWEDADEA